MHGVRQRAWWQCTVSSSSSSFPVELLNDGVIHYHHLLHGQIKTECGYGTQCFIGGVILLDFVVVVFL